jgi:hypothetical protein
MRRLSLCAMVAALAPAPLAAQTVKQVTVTLSSSSLALGGRTTATATARLSNGDTTSSKPWAWGSSQSSVAIVSTKGRVSTIAAGTATITACVSGVCGSAVVSVTAATPPAARPVASVTTVIDDHSLVVNQAAQATAVPRDSSGDVVTNKPTTWTSTNPAVATVSDAGVVTGVGAGSATVTATVDAKAGNVAVTVATPPPPSEGVIVQHNFDDGTMGGFFNPWGSGIDVIADPTSSGHGKVARIHYQNSPPGGVESDRALFPTAGPAMGMGDSLWFKGEFYIPGTADTTVATSLQRKLLYWSWGGVGPHPVAMVINSFGPQLVVRNLPDPSFEPGGSTYVLTSTAKLTSGAWHTLKVQMKVNSTFAATDGVLRIWYDGVAIFDHTNMRWTDPAWLDDPSTIKWYGFGVGYQINTVVPTDEYRYWDNIIYSRSAIP